MRLKNKKSIVTGAASGIGKATAQLFAKEGAKVYALDIDKEGLLETAKDYDNITTAICDVSKKQECQKAVEDAVKELGGIDVLANIAGIFKVHHVLDVDEEIWNKIMNINVNGTFWLSQAAIPHLLESKGNIVNVASTAGLQGQAYTIPYCVSKGAVVLLTKALAMEFIKQDIRINAVAPSGVDTAIAKNFEAPEDIDVELMMRYQGFRGLIPPGDIAEAITWLASDATSTTTGAVLTIDTGMTA